MYLLWLLIDKLISWWLRIKPLRKDGEGIISTQMRRHRGQPVQIDDSTTIRSGDLFIELHMSGSWFISNREQLNSTMVEKRWDVSVAFAEDLRYLASQLTEGKFNPEVRALCAKTLLSSPMQRLGFTVTEAQSGIYGFFTTFYLSKLRQVYYFGKYNKHLLNKKPLTLVEAWMSVPVLLEKYLSY